MPPPTDLTETRKFLGFVGYYRKFIPKYSDIARPLTNLTRKDIPFEWSKACQQLLRCSRSTYSRSLYSNTQNLTNPIYCTQMQVNMLGLACSPKPMCTKKRGREFSIHHPITYVSGLFKGPQLNWAALTKESLCDLHGS